MSHSFSRPNHACPSGLHKYITKNSEYVMNGDLCVEMKARRAGLDDASPVVVPQRLIASVRWSLDGGHQIVRGRLPTVGESMVLGVDQDFVLTSVVRQIEALRAAP